MTINRTKIRKFNGKRKAENGKLFFDFRLEWRDLNSEKPKDGELRVAGTPTVVKAQVLLGFTRVYWGRSLRSLTGERERLRVVGTLKVVTAQRY